MGAAASKTGRVLIKIGDATGGSKQDAHGPAPAGGGGAAAYHAPAGGNHSEVLFFPDGELPCRNYLNDGRCRFGASCKYSHAETNLVRLLRHLRAARATLDVCVFNITCDDIAAAILDAHARGVRVRVITDDEQARSQGSDVRRLAAAGVQCVADNSPYHMHHKFALVDGGLLMNGSLNWTVQGVKSNEENVMVTRDAAFVRAFGTQFEKMWGQFAHNRVA